MPPKKGKTSAFPSTRIKRIIQADDDVGKVAQATPIAVSKAVELFIEELTLAAQAEAQKTGGKKLGLHHIKRAVESKPNFDFLKDLVQAIPDPTEGGAGGEEKPKKRRKTKAKATAEVDDDDEPAGAAPPLPSGKADDDEDYDA